MGMGKGMKMYLMANGGRREDARNNDERRMPKTYNMDGTYNVSVNGGGNRSEGGYMYTGGNNRQERQPDRMEYTNADPMARYRGKDGRYHAGTRRSEYSGGDEMRMGGDEEEEKEYKVKISPESYRHMPPYMPRDEYSTNAYSAERESNYGADGRRRQIGFGASMMGDYEEERGSMQRGMSEYTPMEFDRQTAERWVKSMQNEDKSHPTGGKWSAEMLKPLAQKFGIPTEGKEFWEFYAMTNAMYSDYSEIFKKHGLTSPELYAQLAKAFIYDKDAVPEKVGLYYEFLVKKDD
jgi:hypothetical protein